MNAAVRTVPDQGMTVVAPAITTETVACPANVVAAAFLDAAGDSFAVGLGDGGVWRYTRAGEGFAPAALQRHDGAVTAIAAVGGQVVSTGQDGTVRASAGGGSSALLATDPGWITGLVVHERTGRFAAIAGRDILVFDGIGAEPVRLSAAGSVSGIAFSPAGDRLVASRYGGLTVFTLEPPAPDLTLDWPGSHVAVTWSPDGRYLVSATQDREIHAWDLVTMKDFRMGGYAGKVRSLSWAGASRLACSGADSATVWDFAVGPGSGPPVEFGYGFKSRVSVVAGHPAKEWAAAGYTDGAVQIGGLLKGNARLARSPDGTAVTALVWSADGSTLLAGTRAGVVALIRPTSDFAVD